MPAPFPMAPPDWANRAHPRPIVTTATRNATFRTSRTLEHVRSQFVAVQEEAARRKAAQSMRKEEEAQQKAEAKRRAFSEHWRSLSEAEKQAERHALLNWWMERGGMAWKQPVEDRVRHVGMP